MPAENYHVELTAPTGNTAEHTPTSTTQPTQLAGSKRKSTDTSDLPTINLDDYDVPDGEVMDSCTVVRGKINRFLEAGEMKVGQFCDAIGVSGNAYRRFMSQNGKFAGEQSDAYRGAWEFFKKREMAGLKIPTKKQKVAASDGEASGSSKAVAGKKDKDAHPDIFNIHLDGKHAIKSQRLSIASEVTNTCQRRRHRQRRSLRHLRRSPQKDIRLPTQTKYHSRPILPRLACSIPHRREETFQDSIHPTHKIPRLQRCRYRKHFLCVLCCLCVFREGEVGRGEAEE